MDYFIYKTYAENIKAAEHFLSMAKECDLGQRWNLVGAVAFSAFSIEAFINHAGEAQDAEWQEWDKENRPNSEIKLKRLNVNLVDSMKSQFTELFQLRDMIAHGRTTNISKNVRKPQNNLKGAMNNLSSEFEARTTLKKVGTLVSSAKEIIEFINRFTLGLSNHKLWSIGSGSLRTSQPNKVVKNRAYGAGLATSCSPFTAALGESMKMDDVHKMSLAELEEYL